MITHEQLISIAARHGFPAPASLPQPWVGAASEVYPLDDAVVKVPFDRPDTVAALLTDAAVALIARARGVAAPELIVLDKSLDAVPVPFAIFRRIKGGIPMDRTGRSEPARLVWREVGRQLALVHAVADAGAVPISLRTFRQTPEVDPRPWVDDLYTAGAMGADDARWLRNLLDRIAPEALANVSPTLCHGDVNAANVLVDARTGRFLALIDWAGAGLSDPAWDFSGGPLEVVPWMLEGHRDVAPLPNDGTAEARICWCQVQMRLFSARNMESTEDVGGQVRRHVEQLRHHAQMIGLTSSS